MAVSITWEIPWLALVEVDVGDGAGGEGEVGDLAGEVVGDELLVRRVEPEPRREPHRRHFYYLAICTVSIGGDGRRRRG